MNFHLGEYEAQQSPTVMTNNRNGQKINVPLTTKSSDHFVDQAGVPSKQINRRRSVTHWSSF